MQTGSLHGMGVMALIKKAVKDFFEDDMTTYAAALAYQVLFSIFPFIIFLIAILGFLHVPEFFDWLRQQAQVFIPEQAMQQVNQVIDQLQQPQAGLLSFGVIAALWTASAAVRSLMHALNVAYDARESRPAWKLYPLSIIYTIGIAAMLILAAALLLLGPQAMQWVAQQVGMEQLFVTVWTWLRWPVSFLLLILVLVLIYYAGPNVKQKFRFISPGAVLSILVWIAGSLAFGFYVRNFSDYSMMYGSIGAIVVLLLYFYISAAVLLFGAEVNAVIEHQADEPNAAPA